MRPSQNDLYKQASKLVKFLLHFFGPEKAKTKDIYHGGKSNHTRRGFRVS